MLVAILHDLPVLERVIVVAIVITLVAVLNQGRLCSKGILVFMLTRNNDKVNFIKFH